MNIYIHIPFCASKCSYCHFFSIANSNAIDHYVAALIHEIKLRLPSNAKIESIYFGGGTPSILKPAQLKIILLQLPRTKSCEVSIECHPNTLTVTKIQAYQSMGINRLSIGIQSWNPAVLSKMNRHYNTSRLVRCIKYSRSLGLNNINLDHIIAYPKQTDAILNKDIETTLSLVPTHISIYPLEKHPHTNIKTSPSTSKIIRQFKLIQMKLIKSGYRHYEELNFAFPGYECLHNLNFWQGKDYMGFGASAVSKQQLKLITNTSSITDYINLLTTNQLPPTEIMNISPIQHMQLNQELRARLLK